jgi:hypothetical protein
MRDSACWIESASYFGGPGALAWQRLPCDCAVSGWILARRAFSAAYGRRIPDRMGVQRVGTRVAKCLLGTMRQLSHRAVANARSRGWSLARVDAPHTSSKAHRSAPRTLTPRRYDAEGDIAPHTNLRPLGTFPANVRRDDFFVVHGRRRHARADLSAACVKQWTSTEEERQGP